MKAGRTSRRSFVAAGGAAAASLAAAPAAAQSYLAQFVIAVLAPFSGQDKRLGEQLADGVRAAIDDANRTRGPLDRVYSMRTFDDENSVASAILNARFAIDDQNIAGAIGHLGGRPTDVAVRSYGEAGMPLIVPASSYDRITSHSYRYIYRLPTKDSIEGSLHARFVNIEKRGTNVAVLFQDGDYGFDVANGFIQQARADKLRAYDVGFSWEKPNYAAAARSALAQSPDLIFLAGLAKDLGPIVPVLRAAGYTGNFDASQGFFDGTVSATYGKALEGMVVSTSMPPLTIAPSAFRIKSDFEARYGPLGPIAAFGYSAAQILIAAGRRMSSAQRQTLARAIADPIPFDTLVGSFTFDPYGDPRDPNCYFYTLKDGRFAYQRAAHPSAYIFK